MADLRALGEAAARDLPTVERSVSAARERGVRASRRRKAASLTGVLAALLLVMVPIPHTSVVGYDVALRVSGASGSSFAEAVSREIESVLGARPVAVARAPDATRFTVSVPARSGVDVSGRARSIARALERQGLHAEATVTPRHARVTGSLYAFARDHVIRVRGDGRTASQLEAEIRRRLEEEGLTGAKVSVVAEPQQRRIEVETPGSGSGAGTLGIQLGEASSGEEGTKVDVRKIPATGGSVTFHVDVTRGARTISVEVPHSEALSEGALAREVQSRLKAAGLDATVEIRRGTLRIEMGS
jgi:hypothetical protein